MNWKKLKDYKCPKCFEDLTRNINNQRFECLGCSDFSISQERFNEIITRPFVPKKSKEGVELEDNQSGLNNL